MCIDFDGTLFDHEYPNIGKVKAGARGATELFRELGWKIIIFSCRTCSYNPEVFAPKMDDGTPDPMWLRNVMDRKVVADMVAALSNEGIVFDEIDDGSKGKPYADLYIDDKGLRFEDNWGQIMGRIITGKWFKETV